MGGGDLNTKKSWHPNTMKNQERVWKAEQAAAEEKKRIQELQREREEERDRAQLKELAQINFGGSGAPDNRLHWMYDNKPDKQSQQEDYLLGKAIGKSDEAETQQNAIPAVSRRVVGSSMLTTGDDTQVDLARKLREDPLLLVKERERAARAALLNNPLQRKKLTELLRKEQEQKEKTKKKSKKKGKDLDGVLAAKLNALGAKKGIDLSSLLNSDDSSELSSSDEKSKKKKKKKKSVKEKPKKKKKKKDSSETEASDDEEDTSNKKYAKKRKKEKVAKSKRNKKSITESESDSSSDEEKVVSKKYKMTYSKTDKKSYYDKDNGSDYHYKSSVKRPEHYSKRVETESGSYKDRRNSVDIDTRQERHLNKNREVENRRSHIRDESRDSNRGDHSKRDRSSQKRKHDSGRDEGRASPKRTYDSRTPKMFDVSRERGRNTSPKRFDSRRASSPKRAHEGERNKRVGMSEEERAAKLAEMAAAGAEREVERVERVARHRAAEEAERRTVPHARSEAHSLPTSLETRIRSNRHYIQRNPLHMNEHFARR